MEEQHNFNGEQQLSGSGGGPGAYQVEPHRGAAVLVFGILGLVMCFIFGIIAWVMGNNDLDKMESGQMDRSGEGLTKAGKICGMISVLLWFIGIVFWFLIAGLTVIGGAI